MQRKINHQALLLSSEKTNYNAPVIRGSDSVGVLRKLYSGNLLRNLPVMEVPERPPFPE